MKQMLGEKYFNSSSNYELEVENKDISKFIHDGYNNHKAHKLKKRIAGNYGEILEVAKINPNFQNVSNYKNNTKGKKGFDYYDVTLAYPVKNEKGNIENYRFYEARLVVRKESNGNFAYDLDNFNEKKGITLDNKMLPIAEEISSSDSLSDDSISQSNDNVKLLLNILCKKVKIIHKN